MFTARYPLRYTKLFIAALFTTHKASTCYDICSAVCSWYCEPMSHLPYSTTPIEWVIHIFSAIRTTERSLWDLGLVRALQNSMMRKLAATKQWQRLPIPFSAIITERFETIFWRCLIKNNPGFWDSGRFIHNIYKSLCEQWIFLGVKFIFFFLQTIVCVSHVFPSCTCQLLLFACSQGEENSSKRKHEVQCGWWRILVLCAARFTYNFIRPMYVLWKRRTNRNTCAVYVVRIEMIHRIANTSESSPSLRQTSVP